MAVVQVGLADDAGGEPDCAGLYEPWVRLALTSPLWSEEKVRRAQALRSSTLHLGEVAELMRCSVFEVQAELGIGRSRDVRAYRRIRGLAPAARGQEPERKYSECA